MESGGGGSKDEWMDVAFTGRVRSTVEGEKMRKKTKIFGNRLGFECLDFKAFMIHCCLNA